ncbi:DUF11 domain-containing protein [Actinomadura macrotermitis]|uniref:DUF11 domain-containing protein n=1 Tax=Actinomadura macrotermitis TaxID=2585200 RepID=A0A7K0C1R0_9ACTN|nr:DUF11 domain-containing protein [Actinomadura macrotermitis]MQY07405.1 hypothetical protein [Actinomadura macrotermitis]
MGRVLAVRLLAVYGSAIAVLLPAADPAQAFGRGADLGVSLAGPRSATAGREADYTLTVRNDGPAGARDVTATFALPRGVEVMGLDTPDCRERPGNRLRCRFPALAPGEKRAVQVRGIVAPDATGPLRATARVRSATADPAAHNDRAALSTPLAPGTDVTVRPAVGRPTQRGGPRPVHLAVRNQGRHPAGQVVLNLGAYGARLMTSAADHCRTVRETGHDQFQRCELGPLGPGQTRMVRTVVLPAPVARRLVAAVDTDTGDTEPANNTATTELKG